MLSFTTHLSLGDAEKLVGRINWGIISIGNPPYIDEEEFRANLIGWGSILRMWFHNIDKPWQNYVLFNDDHADSILDWLAVNDPLERIYVHCSAGISRSAAVSKFIADTYGLSFNEHRGGLYNRHVYRMLETRFQERKTG